MKIHRVRLVNFMRYDDAEIELHDGFNAIVGQTDAGKSTLIRALTWVFYNKPNGTEMLRAGTDETRVIIWTDAGIEIERYRSKKRNAYRVDSTWYDAIATGVPEPVQQALNVHFAELGPKVAPEMLNVSRQMDPPFLLSTSGGDAAKILGNLSGLSKIDTGLASLRPDISTAKKAIDVATKLQRNYEASIGEFEGLDEEVAALEVIGTRLAHTGLLNQRLTGLKDVLERMDAFNAVAATVDAEIAEQHSILAIHPRIQAAQQLLERVTQLRSIDANMVRVNVSALELDTQESSVKTQLSELEARYKAVLHEAGQCPTCGAAT